MAAGFAAEPVLQDDGERERGRDQDSSLEPIRVRAPSDQGGRWRRGSTAAHDQGAALVLTAGGVRQPGV